MKKVKVKQLLQQKYEAFSVYSIQYKVLNSFEMRKGEKRKDKVVTH